LLLLVVLQLALLLVLASCFVAGLWVSSAVALLLVLAVAPLYVWLMALASVLALGRVLVLMAVMVGRCLVHFLGCTMGGCLLGNSMNLFPMKVHTRRVCTMLMSLWGGLLIRKLVGSSCRSITSCISS
jgi:hypothetical protein